MHEFFTTGPMLYPGWQCLLEVFGWDHSLEELGTMWNKALNKQTENSNSANSSELL